MLSLMVGLVLCAGEPDAQLLAKLTAHSDRLGVLEKADGTMQVGVKSKELDGDGKITHSKEIEMVLTQSNGKTKTQLKRFVEDGEDTTEDKRGDIESGAKKASRSQEMGVSSLSPFSTESRPKYLFSVVTKPQDAAGTVRLSFWPKGDKSPEVMMGEALVDEASGEVVRLAMQPSKNPPFVDKLVFEADFGEVTSAGRAMSRLRVHGEAGIAFIKKRFDAMSTFHRVSSGG